MAGRVAEETRLKVAVGTAAIASGPASRKKSAIADAAHGDEDGRAQQERHDAPGGEEEREVGRPSARPSRKAAAANAANARARQPAPAPLARRTTRSGTPSTTKPIGITSWLQAVRIPKATIPWLSHSERTSASDAQPRSATVAAETAVGVEPRGAAGPACGEQLLGREA